MSRQKKGTVGVESFRGMLRIRLPRHLFSGQQKYLALGLPDTPINRKAAEAKALAIEADIAFERFDVTLDRYRPQTQPADPILDLVDLWARYTAYKIPLLSATTINKDYRKIANHIASLPKGLTARQVRKHLMSNLSPASAKKALMFINGCCDWAVNEELIDSNPYAKLSIKAAPPRRTINPFSRAEQNMIIKAFEIHDRWSCYAPFVKFLFYCGCRPSEAVALQWKHISPDLSQITFSDAVVLGTRKDTKTHTTRKFPCNQSMQELLSSIRPARALPDVNVFKSPAGMQIDDHNFQNRAWQEIVRALPIPYRSSYSTRHTFITLCLDEGIPVTQVASWVGNSPKTIWQHYAGLVSSHVVPDFSDDSQLIVN